MTIALIQQFYRTAVPGRQEELDTCLRHNLENALIDEVHLLTEEPLDLCAFPHPHKIRQTVIAERLTYARALGYANDTDPHGRNVWLLANADIWFDGSLSALADVAWDGVAFALTRHEIRADGTVELMVPEFAHGSQDAWVFKTPVPVERMFTAFALGIPGCDNRIAHELIAAGYKVLNPSQTIVARHLDLARQSDIFQRNDLYQAASATRLIQYAPPPHQFHIFPVAETDPDSPAVYRVYMQQLSVQYDTICRQTEQMSDHGRILNELYQEIERKAAECEMLRSSLSWRVTAPLRKLQRLLARARRIATDPHPDLG
jgi:hypothetical protein